MSLTRYQVNEFLPSEADKLILSLRAEIKMLIVENKMLKEEYNKIKDAWDYEYELGATDGGHE